MSTCVKKQHTDANAEMIQILGLSLKAFKATITKILQEIRSNTIKMNGNR